MKTKVLVVDDSVFSRQTIKRMLETDPGVEVVSIASSGLDAMKKTLRLRPDIITLDFEMPEMDGFSFLRWLVQQQMSVPVIMVSSYSDTKTVFRALELGAVDFIAKPSRKASAELQNIERDLLSKVRGLRGLNMSVLNRNLQLLKEPEIRHGSSPLREDISVVAVGASTGGPSALQAILKSLPGDFPTGIIISQHMPRGFTRSLAERINELSMLKVKEAKEGDQVESGSALICPGGYHMTVKKRGRKMRVALRKASEGDKYTPSVDLLMLSAAEHCGGDSMGVILTGMGNDGMKGMSSIRAAGGYTIAESKDTAVVFGMPGSAIKAGAVERTMPLQNIAGEMIRVVMGERRVGPK